MLREIRTIEEQAWDMCDYTGRPGGWLVFRADGSTNWIVWDVHNWNWKSICGDFDTAISAVDVLIKLRSKNYEH